MIFQLHFAEAGDGEQFADDDDVVHLLVVIKVGRNHHHHTARREADEHTLYSLASITKPVTVTALMLLVERGQVSLLDSVQKYLSESFFEKNAQLLQQGILKRTVARGRTPTRSSTPRPRALRTSRRWACPSPTLRGDS
ncbi:MAG: serine hydrolase, partial [Aquincola sp.]|nr:serine hydrolase [Aquincola sp.]